MIGALMIGAGLGSPQDLFGLGPFRYTVQLQVYQGILCVSPITH